MSELTSTCENCGTEIDASRSRGNPREYCSGACRTASCRHRKRVRDASAEVGARSAEMEARLADELPHRRLVHRDRVNDAAGRVIDRSRAALETLADE